MEWPQQSRMYRYRCSRCHLLVHRTSFQYDKDGLLVCDSECDGDLPSRCIWCGDVIVCRPMLLFDRRAHRECWKHCVTKFGYRELVTRFESQEWEEFTRGETAKDVARELLEGLVDHFCREYISDAEEDEGEEDVGGVRIRKEQQGWLICEDASLHRDANVFECPRKFVDSIIDEAVALVQELNDEDIYDVIDTYGSMNYEKVWERATRKRNDTLDYMAMSSVNITSETVVSNEKLHSNLNSIESLHKNCKRTFVDKIIDEAASNYLESSDEETSDMIGFNTNVCKEGNVCNQHKTRLFSKSWNDLQAFQGNSNLQHTTKFRKSESFGDGDIEEVLHRTILEDTGDKVQEFKTISDIDVNMDRAKVCNQIETPSGCENDDTKATNKERNRRRRRRKKGAPGMPDSDTSLRDGSSLSETVCGFARQGGSVDGNDSNVSLWQDASNLATDFGMSVGGIEHVFSEDELEEKFRIALGCSEHPGHLEQLISDFKSTIGDIQNRAIICRQCFQGTEDEDRAGRGTSTTERFAQVVDELLNEIKELNNSTLIFRKYAKPQHVCEKTVDGDLLSTPQGEVYGSGNMLIIFDYSDEGLKSEPTAVYEYLANLQQDKESPRCVQHHGSDAIISVTNTSSYVVDSVKRTEFIEKSGGSCETTLSSNDNKNEVSELPFSIFNVKGMDNKTTSNEPIAGSTQETNVSGTMNNIKCTSLIHKELDDTTIIAANEENRIEEQCPIDKNMEEVNEKLPSDCTGASVDDCNLTENENTNEENVTSSMELRNPTNEISVPTEASVDMTIYKEMHWNQTHTDFNTSFPCLEQCVETKEAWVAMLRAGHCDDVSPSGSLVEFSGNSDKHDNADEYLASEQQKRKADDKSALNREGNLTINENTIRTHQSDVMMEHAINTNNEDEEKATLERDSKHVDGSCSIKKINFVESATNRTGNKDQGTAPMLRTSVSDSDVSFYELCAYSRLPSETTSDLDQQERCTWREVRQMVTEEPTSPLEHSLSLGASRDPTDVYQVDIEVTIHRRAGPKKPAEKDSEMRRSSIDLINVFRAVSPPNKPRECQNVVDSDTQVKSGSQEQFQQVIEVDKRAHSDTVQNCSSFFPTLADYNDVLRVCSTNDLGEVSSSQSCECTCCEGVEIFTFDEAIVTLQCGPFNQDIVSPSALSEPNVTRKPSEHQLPVNTVNSRSGVLNNTGDTDCINDTSHTEISPQNLNADNIDQNEQHMFIIDHGVFSNEKVITLPNFGDATILDGSKSSHLLFERHELKEESSNEVLLDKRNGFETVTELNMSTSFLSNQQEDKTITVAMENNEEKSASPMQESIHRIDLGESLLNKESEKQLTDPNKTGAKGATVLPPISTQENQDQNLYNRIKLEDPSKTQEVKIEKSQSLENSICVSECIKYSSVPCSKIESEEYPSHVCDPESTPNNDFIELGLVCSKSETVCSKNQDNANAEVNVLHEDTLDQHKVDEEVTAGPSIKSMERAIESERIRLLERHNSDTNTKTIVSPEAKGNTQSFSAETSMENTSYTKLSVDASEDDECGSGLSKAFTESGLNCPNSQTEESVNVDNNAKEELVQHALSKEVITDMYVHNTEEASENKTDLHLGGDNSKINTGKAVSTEANDNTKSVKDSLEITSSAKMPGDKTHFYVGSVNVVVEHMVSAQENVALAMKDDIKEQVIKNESSVITEVLNGEGMMNDYDMKEEEAVNNHSLLPSDDSNKITKMSENINVTSGACKDTENSTPPFAENTIGTCKEVNHTKDFVQNQCTDSDLLDDVNTDIELADLSEHVGEDTDISLEVNNEVNIHVDSDFAKITILPNPKENFLPEKLCVAHDIQKDTDETFVHQNNESYNVPTTVDNIPQVVEYRININDINDDVEKESVGREDVNNNIGQHEQFVFEADNRTQLTDIVRNYNPCISVVNDNIFKDTEVDNYMCEDVGTGNKVEQDGGNNLDKRVENLSEHSNIGFDAENNECNDSTDVSYAENNTNVSQNVEDDIKVPENACSRIGMPGDVTETFQMLESTEESSKHDLINEDIDKNAPSDLEIKSMTPEIIEDINSFENDKNIHLRESVDKDSHIMQDSCNNVINPDKNLTQDVNKNLDNDVMSSDGIENTCLHKNVEQDVKLTEDSLNIDKNVTEGMEMRADVKKNVFQPQNNVTESSVSAFDVQKDVQQHVSLTSDEHETILGTNLNQGEDHTDDIDGADTHEDECRNTELYQQENNGIDQTEAFLHTDDVNDMDTHEDECMNTEERQQEHNNIDQADECLHTDDVNDMDIHEDECTNTEERQQENNNIDQADEFLHTDNVSDMDIHEDECKNTEECQQGKNSIGQVEECLHTDYVNDLDIYEGECKNTQERQQKNNDIDEAEECLHTNDVNIMDVPEYECKNTDERQQENNNIDQTEECLHTDDVNDMDIHEDECKNIEVHQLINNNTDQVEACLHKDVVINMNIHKNECKNIEVYQQGDNVVDQSEVDLYTNDATANKEDQELEESISPGTNKNSEDFFNNVETIELGTEICNNINDIDEDVSNSAAVKEDLDIVNEICQLAHDNTNQHGDEILRTEFDAIDKETNIDTRPPEDTASSTLNPHKDITSFDDMGDLTHTCKDTKKGMEGNQCLDSSRYYQGFWLGNVVDTVNMQISLSNAKLDNALNITECKTSVPKNLGNYPLLKDRVNDIHIHESGVNEYVDKSVDDSENINRKIDNYERELLLKVGGKAFSGDVINLFTNQNRDANILNVENISKLLTGVNKDQEDDVDVNQDSNVPETNGNRNVLDKNVRINYFSDDVECDKTVAKNVASTVVIPTDEFINDEPVKSSNSDVDDKHVDTEFKLHENNNTNQLKEGESSTGLVKAEKSCSDVPESSNTEIHASFSTTKNAISLHSLSAEVCDTERPEVRDSVSTNFDSETTKVNESNERISRNEKDIGFEYLVDNTFNSENTDIVACVVKHNEFVTDDSIEANENSSNVCETSLQSSEDIPCTEKELDPEYSVDKVFISENPGIDICMEKNTEIETSIIIDGLTEPTDNSSIVPEPVAKTSGVILCNEVEVGPECSVEKSFNSEATDIDISIDKSMDFGKVIVTGASIEATDNNSFISDTRFQTNAVISGNEKQDEYSVDKALNSAKNGVETCSDKNVELETSMATDGSIEATENSSSISDTRFESSEIISGNDKQDEYSVDKALNSANTDVETSDKNIELETSMTTDGSIETSEKSSFIPDTKFESSEVTSGNEKEDVPEYSVDKALNSANTDVETSSDKNIELEMSMATDASVETSEKSSFIPDTKFEFNEVTSGNEKEDVPEYSVHEALNSVNTGVEICSDKNMDLEKSLAIDGSIEASEKSSFISDNKFESSEVISGNEKEDVPEYLMDETLNSVNTGVEICSDKNIDLENSVAIDGSIEATNSSITSEPGFESNAGRSIIEDQNVDQILTEHSVDMISCLEHSDQSCSLLCDIDSESLLEQEIGCCSLSDDVLESHSSTYTSIRSSDENIVCDTLGTDGPPSMESYLESVLRRRKLERECLNYRSMRSKSSSTRVDVDAESCGFETSECEWSSEPRLGMGGSGSDVSSATSDNFRLQNTLGLLVRRDNDCYDGDLVDQVNQEEMMSKEKFYSKVCSDSTNSANPTTEASTNPITDNKLLVTNMSDNDCYKLKIEHNISKRPSKDQPDEQKSTSITVKRVDNSTAKPMCSREESSTQKEKPKHMVKFDNDDEIEERAVDLETGSLGEVTSIDDKGSSFETGTRRKSKRNKDKSGRKTSSGRHHKAAPICVIC